MRRFIIGSLMAFLALESVGQTTLPVRDNSDVTLSLSQVNFNRLFMKNDTILDFAYPKGAMDIQKDKGDGSVYILPINPNPFTLFLTTEAGHHFSVTVTPEDSLGKTVELVAPKIATAQNPVKSRISTSPKIAEETHADGMLEIIKHMELKELMPGMKVSHPFGRVERMGAGLSLVPKEIWSGEGIEAARLEIYNGGSKELNLLPEWFEGKDVTAMKLSQPTLKPHEKAILYRVREVAHG
jgi:conjugal transfer pilus assembly protein TraK